MTSDQLVDLIVKVLSLVGIVAGPYLVYLRFKAGKRKIDSAQAADSLAETAAGFAHNVADSYERQFAILNQTVGKLEEKVQRLEVQKMKDDQVIATQERLIKQQTTELHEARKIIQEQSAEIMNLQMRVGELEAKSTAPLSVKS